MHLPSPTLTRLLTRPDLGWCSPPLHTLALFPVVEIITRDFCVPQAPAALLKAVLICAGIVRLPPAAAASSVAHSHPTVHSSGEASPSATAATDVSGRSGNVSQSLEEQLARVFGRGGIRITSRSGLPQGSGMGTSSILAGKRG